MKDEGQRPWRPRKSGVLGRDRTDPVSVALDVARHVERLNWEHPLPEEKQDYRKRGVKSAIKNGRVGNKAWSLSMNMKKLAKWRWQPWTKGWPPRPRRVKSLADIIYVRLQAEKRARQG